MYADPRKIKKHEFKFRADDDLYEILMALQEESGEQMGVVVRALVIKNPEIQRRLNQKLIAA